MRARAALSSLTVLATVAAIGCATETPSAPGDPPNGGDPPDNGEATATKVAFLVEPDDGDRDVPLATIEVAIQDEDGETVVTATDAVTVTLTDDSGGATLGGTTTVDPVDGVAAFTDVTLDATGSGYTLEATSGDLTSATSAPFDVTFGFQQVATGQSHSCGVRANGDAYCWGSNAAGQLGIGSDTAFSSTPEPVLADDPLVAVAAGTSHTCGLAAEGSAYCWGNNNVGQLGDGSDAASEVPVVVAGGHTFTAITVGADHGCGLTEAGTAYCWGAGNAGQRGDSATTLVALEPVAVRGGHPFTALEAGGSHTCAAVMDGSAYCWGNNGTDQLGDGSGQPNQIVPVAVQGGLAFTALAVGGNHTCGVTSAADAHCWGFNFFGQLGDDSADQRPEPTPVEGGLTFASVAAGADHTCGVTTAGQAFCWGFGQDGRLGDGSGADSPTPAAVQGDLSFSMVAPGGVHTCAVAQGGAAFCWGLNGFGQLGDGGTDEQTMPVAVLEPRPSS